MPGVLEYEMIQRVVRAVRAGQVADQAQPHVEPGRALRSARSLRSTERDNPLFSDPNEYPVDKNNIAPRLGFVWNPDGESKSVIRGGYGMFYDRTLLGTIDDFLFATKYSDVVYRRISRSTVRTIPGYTAGRLPDEAVLRQTQFAPMTPQMRAIINAQYPAGSLRAEHGPRLSGTIPSASSRYFHQSSVGYERELRRGLSVSADYVSMRGKDMFINPDLNIATALEHQPHRSDHSHRSVRHPQLEPEAR